MHSFVYFLYFFNLFLSFFCLMCYNLYHIPCIGNRKMKRRKTTNIKQLLTKYFVILTIVVLLTTTTLFSAIQYHASSDSAKKNLTYTCQSISESIDLYIKQLDTIILNAINSGDLTSSLSKYSDDHYSEHEHQQQRIHMSSVLTSIKGFEYSVRQLSAYSLNDIGYGVGDYIGPLSGYSDESWYQATLDAHGRRYIPVVSDEDDYLTIYRSYFDSYYHPAGIIEAKMYYSDVFHTAISPSSTYEPTIIVYNINGEIIYPAANDIPEQMFPYWDHRQLGSGTVFNTVTELTEYVTYSKTTHTNMTVVAIVPNYKFVAQILYSNIGVIFIFALVLSLGMLLAFYMARTLSDPITCIYSFLSAGDNHENDQLDMEPTGILEFDQLANSINRYIAESKEKTQTILTLNEQEVQAQMLALQSQMNPHFLYNSLASISEMAREGLTDSISTMTMNISNILRYISSNRKQSTSIEEELELCDMYLECMKLRFTESLHYRFDVDDQMLDYMIPKLCIQLLVENAIKSVTTLSPPWHIRVYGYIENDIWYIEVQDNGPGFDPEVDRLLRKQMDNILETKTLPSLKIQGMGILNIFIRFYLLDGITFIFDFGNRPEGGAFVKVGRKIGNSNEQS